ncbi:hypothetical protein F511_16896 [Dorcoceras hygrometricum]|uniref:Uncharacterized protein n=1 Tax=Dorcoceras hygrometricum TaxID=472368 RepID=A0A2Z7CRX0_9LAMI|nr:hypothetical protein F511_16896 [Dorcoceras hygrometricum]
MDEGIDQLNFHSAQLGYLKLLQMGTQTQQDKAGNKYEVKPQYEELSKQLGGRHSHPVVTAPTIALDFSDTTQQSASHNVAPNQTTKNRAQTTRIAHPKAHASRRTHALTFLKSFEVQQLRVSTSSEIQLLKWVANERAKQGKSSATKISKNKGWMRRKSREEMSRTEKEVGEGLNPGLSMVQMEALFGDVTRRIRAELELLHDRMSRLEVSASGGKSKSKKGESEFDGEDESEGHRENWDRNKRDQGYGRGRHATMRGR